MQIKDKTTIRMGFSPCPNDTFILDALVNGKIPVPENLNFEWIIEDVEQLNRMAINGALDVTKLSFGVVPLILETYQLLNAGSALGKACGPLLIYKEKPEDLEQALVGIPGWNTTAHFLLKRTYPELGIKKEMLFSDIEDALLNNEIDLGLIIHENRFTYQEKGLKLLADLGELWEKTTNQHIPLGGFAIKRAFSIDLKRKINHLIFESLSFGWENPDSSQVWIKSLSQETDNQVIKKHISLYVNEFSLDLGNKGKSAIQHLLDIQIKSDKSQKNNLPLFFD